MSKFAPFSAEELSATPIDLPPAQDGFEIVSPIPADDAPPMPGAHPALGDATARWTYRNADGAPLFYIWRFDPPGERKQFIPLTMQRDAGGLRWSWKAAPAPRPLYGLDRLAARPDASVIVCEGEKAADAVARVFPSSVAVTSSGGAQAHSKSDWTPLAARRVGRRPKTFTDCNKESRIYRSPTPPPLHAQAGRGSVHSR